MPDIKVESIAKGQAYSDSENFDASPEMNFIVTQVSAALGNSHDQYKLATMYENGLGTEKNIYEAIKWYIESSLNGELEHDDKISELPKKYSEEYVDFALEYLKSKVENNSKAADLIGEILFNKYLTKENESEMDSSEKIERYNEVIEWYEKANEHDKANNLRFSLANTFYSEGSADSKQKSLDIYLKLINEQYDFFDEDAAHIYMNIGNIYLEQGNTLEAIECYEHAIYEYMSYDNDREEAFNKLVELATDQNNSDAQYVLGRYFLSECLSVISNSYIDKNTNNNVIFNKMIDWLTKAYENGHPEAQRTLGIAQCYLAKHFYEIGKDGKAFKFLENAASNGIKAIQSLFEQLKDSEYFYDLVEDEIKACDWDELPEIFQNEKFTLYYDEEDI